MTSVQVFAFYVLPVILGLLAWIGVGLNDWANGKPWPWPRRRR